MQSEPTTLRGVMRTTTRSASSFEAGLNATSQVDLVRSAGIGRDTVGVCVVGYNMISATW